MGISVSRVGPPAWMMMLTALSLVGSASGSPAGGKTTPAGWLDPADKDAGWVRRTARSRELLGKLDATNPVVRRWLDRLEARCRALRRVGGPHGWYEAVPFDFLQAMLEDLAAGVDPMKRYAGKGVGFPYWSPATARVQSIWVHVPPKFDPARKYQMFMYYKCGGGIHYKNGKASGARRRKWPTIPTPSTSGARCPPRSRGAWGQCTS